jgi:hypothetical protein
MSLLEYERRAGRRVTFTHVAVALALLRERGILDVRYARLLGVRSGGTAPGSIAGTRDIPG